MSTTFSRKLMAELKLYPEPAYKLAIEFGLTPSALSMLLNGGQKVDPEDHRLQALVKKLGLTAAEAFDVEEEEPAVAAQN